MANWYYSVSRVVQKWRHIILGQYLTLFSIPRVFYYYCIVITKSLTLSPQNRDVINGLPLIHSCGKLTGSSKLKTILPGPTFGISLLDDVIDGGGVWLIMTCKKYNDFNCQVKLCWKNRGGQSTFGGPDPFCKVLWSAPRIRL